MGTLRSPAAKIDSGHFAATSALFLFLPALHAWPCHPGRQETRGRQQQQQRYCLPLPTSEQRQGYTFENLLQPAVRGSCADPPLPRGLSSAAAFLVSPPAGASSTSHFLSLLWNCNGKHHLGSGMPNNLDVQSDSCEGCQHLKLSSPSDRPQRCMGSKPSLATRPQLL